jgi:hypothetical protein
MLFSRTQLRGDRSSESHVIPKGVSEVSPEFLQFSSDLGRNFSTGSGVPRILFGWGVSTNSVDDRGQRERGSGGGSPLVRGSGGSCNLVQEISFHIVNFS